MARPSTTASAAPQHRAIPEAPNVSILCSAFHGGGARLRCVYRVLPTEIKAVTLSIEDALKGIRAAVGPKGVVEDAQEIERCQPWLARETDLLRPELVIAVGTLAIEQVLGLKAPLTELVGTARRSSWYGRDLDVVALPHPSGASPWHKMEPGKTLLGKALRTLARHPAMRPLLER